MTAINKENKNIIQLDKLEITESEIYGTIPNKLELESLSLKNCVRKGSKLFVYTKEFPMPTKKLTISECGIRVPEISSRILKIRDCTFIEGHKVTINSEIIIFEGRQGVSMVDCISEMRNVHTIVLHDSNLYGLSLEFIILMSIGNLKRILLYENRDPSDLGVDIPDAVELKILKEYPSYLLE